MTSNGLPNLTPAQERAREAVVGLADPPPAPEFRAALKQAFVTGEFAVPAAAPAGRPEQAERPRTFLGLRPATWRWALAPAAMAAVSLVLVLADRGPAWRLARTTGTGVAVIDDWPVPINHREELRFRLRPGARIRMPETDGTIEIASRGALAIELLPGADVVLPQPPGRWFQRGTRAELRRGHVRVTSGSRFRGGRLEIVTPEVEVEMTGTSFAVICEPTGTCVCVHEGRVRVGPPGGERVEVAAGERRFVFNDGRPPEHAGIRPGEPPALESLRRRNAPRLR